MVLVLVELHTTSEGPLQPMTALAGQSVPTMVTHWGSEHVVPEGHGTTMVLVLVELHTTSEGPLQPMTVLAGQSVPTVGRHWFPAQLTQGRRGGGWCWCP